MTVSRHSADLQVYCEVVFSFEARVMTRLQLLDVDVEDSLVDLILKDLVGELEVDDAQAFEVTVAACIYEWKNMLNPV